MLADSPLEHRAAYCSLSMHRTAVTLVQGQSSILRSSCSLRSCQYALRAHTLIPSWRTERREEGGRERGESREAATKRVFQLRHRASITTTTPPSRLVSVTTPHVRTRGSSSHSSTPTRFCTPLSHALSALTDTARPCALHASICIRSSRSHRPRQLQRPH